MVLGQFPVLGIGPALCKSNVGFVGRIQPVDATSWLNRSAAVSCYAALCSPDVPFLQCLVSPDCSSDGSARFTGATIPDPRAPFTPFSSPAP